MGKPCALGGVDVISSHLVLFGGNTAFLDRFENGRFRHPRCFGGGSQGVHGISLRSIFHSQTVNSDSDHCQGIGRAVGNKG